MSQRIASAQQRGTARRGQWFYGSSSTLWKRHDASRRRLKELGGRKGQSGEAHKTRDAALRLQSEEQEEGGWMAYDEWVAKSWMELWGSVSGEIDPLAYSAGLPTTRPQVGRASCGAQGTVRCPPATEARCSALNKASHKHCALSDVDVGASNAAKPKHHHMLLHEPHSYQF